MKKLKQSKEFATKEEKSDLDYQLDTLRKENQDLKKRLLNSYNRRDLRSETGPLNTTSSDILLDK